MRLIVILALTLPFGLHAQTSFENGKLFFEARKYEEAKPLLKNVKERTGDFAGAQYLLGRISFEQKNFDDAAD